MMTLKTYSILVIYVRFQINKDSNKTLKTSAVRQAAQMSIRQIIVVVAHVHSRTDILKESAVSGL